MKPFRFPHDVDGWLHEAEGRMLATYAMGRDVLEIGSYCGKSTICMAQTAKSVVAVDPHCGHGTPNPRDTLSEFVANVERYGIAESVTLLHGLTDMAADRCQKRGLRFGFIFIDGDHQYEAVKYDIDHTLPLLTPDGMIAFHDYRWGTSKQGYDAGVEQAVNEFLETGAAIVLRVGSLAVVQPKAT